MPCPRSFLVLASAAFCLAGFTPPTAAGSEPSAVVRLSPRRLPGVQPGGEILLPRQWSLRPAGKQIELGNFPVNIARHPRGPWVAVLHSGYGENRVVIVDLKSGRVQSQATVPVSFYGLCFDPQGKRLFASGGEGDVVHQFQFADGELSAHRTISVAIKGKRAVPAGLACSPDGATLYAACCWGDALAVLTPDKPDARHDLALPKGSYPYTVLPSARGDRLYVSLWGRSGVAVVDRRQLRLESVWATASHPTEMVLSPDEKLLYVACADSNSVQILATETGRVREVINTALYPKAPNGSTPLSLDLTPDGKTLYVANADNNNLAVVDVSRPGQARSLGFIPVGWYPTSVRAAAAGESILVANGKGLQSKANPGGPNPLRKGSKRKVEYIGGLFLGSLSIIPRPTPVQMALYNQQAYQCSPLMADPDAAPRTRGADHPIPAKVGQPSPIKHCIYVIKENRTYDQMLGDMREGNGDPALCIFGEQVTPNHHALARQFVLLDNFYVDGEVSANGHEWTMAAYATDFVEKVWPLNYRPGGKLAYPAEGAFAIAQPASGYLWDRCRESGVSYRSYGEFIENGRTPADPGTARVKALEGHFDPQFRGFDLNYPDARRADRFLEELRRFEAEGNMPRFIVLRLPSDHTHGTSRGAHTPVAMVADNDLALGRIVEAISKSKFWPETAVFVLEDDAQNGSDHVDAHRSPALVISPYTKRRSVDSTMYSTSSMLRTMELILGLRPMTQFDAAAQPLDVSFQGRRDLTPYAHLPARVDVDARNAALAWGAEQSAKMDFSKEDAADELLLNEIIWKSVRGADSPMPPPVRASFVRGNAKEEE